MSILNNYYNENFVKEFLTFKQRLALKLSGYVYLCDLKLKGWLSFLPVYIVKCDKHKCYFLDYPQGQGHFTCPLCLNEEGEHSA